MQSSKICCPIHPTEPVQRVNLELHATQQLFCMECILSQDDSCFDRSTLKSIAELIDIAAKHYQLNKDKASLSSDVPSDYLDALSGQAESLESLSKHIEGEKKKVEHVFEMITKDFLRVIEEKKNEYLYSLDQQLFNLRYWYIFFDKQIKKNYPTPDDIPFLFPTKEDLNNKLQKISNSTQLTAFVRNLKEDLNENKLVPVRTDPKTFLNNLKAELTKLEKTKPIYSTEGSEVSEVKTDMKKNLEEALEKLLILENPIKDVVQGRNFDSKIMSGEQFELVRSYMPSGYRFDLKLLYRGTKDGMDGNKFHALCDGKGATITIIKGQFVGTNKDNIFGGFLDQSWSMNNQYINSAKAFLFSVTKRMKCPVQNAQHAGYGAPNCGPVFGAYDIVTMSSNQNYIKKTSYQNTLEMAEKNENNNNNNGKKAVKSANQINFALNEIEVYLVK